MKVESPIGASAAEKLSQSYVLGAGESFQKEPETTDDDLENNNNYRSRDLTFGSQDSAPLGPDGTRLISRNK